MRDWINNNDRLVTIGSIGLIAAALAWMISAKSASDDPTRRPNSDLVSDLSWYYDVTTGEAFQDDWRQVPPIKSPAGNEGVRVSFFSCGSCGTGERFAAYYLKYTPEFKKRSDADASLFDVTAGESCEGRLYSIDAKTWIAAPTASAAGVLEHFRERCKDGRLRRCP